MHSITSYNRIVIKIGSAVLADSDGRVNHTILSSISEDVAWLIKNGKEVLIVSSGAIALGRKKIKFSSLKILTIVFLPLPLLSLEHNMNL